MSDVIIIGAGTAGLTAAIYCGRAGKSVTVIERESAGGQIIYSPLVDNYPGLPGVSGADYAAALAGQAESFGAVIEYAEVLSVTRTEDVFKVGTDTGDFFGRALILATGTCNKKGGFENEEALTGRGVSYCALCDGAFYGDADVAVLGGGNTALTDALTLAGICRKVYLIHRRDEFRGEKQLALQLIQKENVEFVMDSVIKTLNTDGNSLTGVTVTNKKTGEERVLDVKCLFIAIGHVPNTEKFKGLVELDDEGYIRAAEDCLTSADGIFAAGDCRTKTVRQLATAAGDGASAAAAVCAFLNNL